jgi:hypothetical protein
MARGIITKSNDKKMITKQITKKYLKIDAKIKHLKMI